MISVYYAAWRARDMNALLAIFPNAGANDRTRMDALRKNFESCDYEWSVVEVTPVTASRAFVTVNVTEACKARIRMKVDPFRSSKNFELNKGADGRWLITR